MTRVERIRRVSLGGTLAAGLAGGVVLAAMPAGWFSAAGGRSVLLASGAYLLAYQVFSYLSTYLQSATRFDDFSRVQVELAVAMAVMGIPLALWQGAAGAMAGQASAFAVVAVVGWRRYRLPARPLLDRSEWLRLVRVGLPILVVSVGYVFLTTIDRWVIRHLLGSDALGQYAFQARFVSLGVLVATLIANQVYPRAAETWGRTRDMRALVSVMTRPALSCLLVAVASALLIVTVLPIVVPRVWPEYVPSLAVMPYLLLGMLFLPQCALCGVLLNVTDRQLQYLGVQAAALLVALAITGTTAYVTRDLTRTALASAAAYAVYWLMLAALSARVVRAAAAPPEALTS